MFDSLFPAPARVPVIDLDDSCEPVLTPSGPEGHGDIDTSDFNESGVEAHGSDCEGRVESVPAAGAVIAGHAGHAGDAADEPEAELTHGDANSHDCDDDDEENGRAREAEDNNSDNSDTSSSHWNDLLEAEDNLKFAAARVGYTRIELIYDPDTLPPKRRRCFGSVQETPSRGDSQ